MSVSNFTNGSGQWGITMNVLLGADGRSLSVDAFSDVPNPGGGWRPIIVDAISTACFAQLGVTIDLVMFPDFDIVSV